MSGSTSTLILGIGNPILTDDSVGLVVAEDLHRRLPPGAAALRTAHLGGIELLDILAGWKRVLVIDSVEPGRLGPGEVAEIALDELERAYAPITPHNAGFPICLRLGRTLGMPMPEDVRVFAIGVRDIHTFGEKCTPEVQDAIPRIVERIEERAFGPGGFWPIR